MQSNVFAAHLDALGVPYRFVGPTDVEIHGYCTLTAPQDGCITWVKHGNEPLLSAVPPEIRLLVVGDERGAEQLEQSCRSLLLCADPKAVFFELEEHFFLASQRPPAGISPHAVVETDQIGKNVSIGPFCYICAGTVIGDDVCIYNNVSIDCPTHIGKGCIIRSGVRIGSIGFGYYDGLSGHKQQVPHTGGVWIGDYVEIDANCCISRGTIGDTRIGNHVKFDNLCHVGHNVVIDDDCLITACAMFAGSVHMKKNGYVGPGSCIMNQAVIGEHAFLGMGAVVLRDVPDNTVVAGVPAKVLRENV